VVVLTCFVKCVCVGGVVMCGCFENCVGVLAICVLVFTLLYCVYCVFVLFRLCIFILTCFVCTSVKDHCHRVTTQLQ